jgi:hypothetical protein
MNWIPRVLEVLAAFRPSLVRYERQLGDRIAEALATAGVPFSREARLGRFRIDFLVEGGVGIELKKGKPDSAAVSRQVERYCRFQEVRVLVLVVERNVFDVPEVVRVADVEKKVHYVALNRQGGIAL